MSTSFVYFVLHAILKNFMSEIFSETKAIEYIHKIEEIMIILVVLLIRGQQFSLAIMKNKVRKQC